MQKIKKYKLICPDPENFSKKVIQLIKKDSNFDAYIKPLDQRSFEKIVHKFDIVLIRFNHTIEYSKYSKVKYILSPTTGLDHISNLFIKSDNTKVISLNGEYKFLKNIRATVEHTILLILISLRNINNTSKSKKIKKGREIYEKNIGIIGIGRVGSLVSKILASFGAKIYFFEKDREKKLKFSKKYKYLPINKLLKICDIISIHIPLVGNYNFLNKNNLSFIKKNSYLINTSRPKVVDEKALIEVKKENNLFYATDFPFKLSKKNIFSTPHIAGMTVESIEKTDLFIFSKLMKHIKS